MVVDCVEQEGVAPDLAAVRAPAFSDIPAPRVHLAPHPSMDPVSAPIGDPPELLDVYVDHVTGPVIFVSTGTVPAADPDPRGRVREPQWRATVAGEDAVDPGDVQVQVICGRGLRFNPVVIG